MNSQYLQKKKLPDAPGVYFFLNAQKKILYIGKATSLRDRVKSYFANDLEMTRGPLLVKMVAEATSIDYKETASVLEALLLEADLIKKFHPDYNSREKDDKSFLCIVLTKEDFPQLLTIRKKDLGDSSKYKAVYGPYTNGLQLREALKIIRKIFPYRDNKCHVCGSVKNSRCKPCFNRQIGLCPGTCTSEVTKREYARTIKYLETLFSGRIDKLVKDLEREMKTLAKDKKFEEASVLRNKIHALTHIQDVALIKDNALRADQGRDVFRIESYDIAHMSGKDMVGVMTVVCDRMLDKGAYRKFKIQGFDSSNDPGALREVFTRRLNHLEWPLPSLIVVDGGEVQRSVMEEVLTEHNLSIPVVSVVKDERHQPRDVLGSQELAIKHRKEILSSNAEAHRFAIGYHKKLRRKNFLS